MRTAENLKRIRISIGLRQQDVANKVGVTRSTISRWERGENAIPEKYLSRFNKTFGVDITIKQKIIIKLYPLPGDKKRRWWHFGIL